ncbi:hypothetical protein [Streptomyces albogriseolus]
MHAALGRVFSRVFTFGVHAGMPVVSAVSFAAAVPAAVFLLRRPATA